MTILVFGKNGQVGQALAQLFFKHDSVILLDRAQANLGDAQSVQAALMHYAPRIIINAAAYTAVDKAESEPAVAFAVNAEAVATMAAYAAAHNSLLIHYSTDYVFDGCKDDPYLESDPTNPLNVYGQSKRAGELAIEASGCRAYIFRTSWVFSSYGNNFVKTILRLAAERHNLNIVADQYGAPTAASRIAALTLAVLDKPIPYGLYHMTAAGETTWHGLARYVVEVAQSQGQQLTCLPENIAPIPTEQYPTPAQRPRNSRLNTKALVEALHITLPSWEVDVAQTVTTLVQASLGEPA